MRERAADRAAVRLRVRDIRVPLSPCSGREERGWELERSRARCAEGCSRLSKSESESEDEDEDGEMELTKFSIRFESSAASSELEEVVLPVLAPRGRPEPIGDGNAERVREVQGLQTFWSTPS
jgi:hypothetical protein